MNSAANSPAAPIPTALGELHRQNGATIGLWFGCSLPDQFGDWQAEHHQLRYGIALLDKSYRAYLDFSGPDRFRYLNAILTNNIKDLPEDHGVTSLFLSPQGRILAEIEAYNLRDTLFCVSYANIREALLPVLDQYIIMDEVTLTDRTDDSTTLALEGPKAALVTEQLTGIDITDLAELETRLASVGPFPCRLGKRSPGGTASAEFFIARKYAESLWEFLIGVVREHGGGPAGYLALSSFRLELGIPWFGYDFGERQIPHEAGLQDSHISYTKGCYTGQEIVERVRSRGQVNRLRVTLKYDSSQPPSPGTVLLSEGKEAGYTTRGAFSPTLRAPIGMAYLRREISAPGAVVELPDGSRASVIPTPVP